MKNNKTRLEKENYIQAAAAWRDKANEVQAELRLLAPRLERCLRRRFFLGVVDMLGNEHVISPQGRFALSLLLDGKDIPYIAEETGLKPEQIRGLVYNAIRKASALIDFGRIKRENERLRLENAELSRFRKINDGNAEERAVAAKVHVLLESSIADLPFSHRLSGALQSAGFVTLGDVVQHTFAQIRRLNKIGDKTIQELEKYLARNGLCLGYTLEEARQYTL